MSAHWICDRCNAIEAMTFHPPREKDGFMVGYSITPQMPEGWMVTPPRNETEERRWPDRNVLCPTCTADYEDFMEVRA